MIKTRTTKIKSNKIEESIMTITMDREHKKVFPDVPIIDFKNNKNLKSYLVRTVLPNINEVGRCQPCYRKGLLVIYAATRKIQSIKVINQSKFIK